MTEEKDMQVPETEETAAESEEIRDIPEEAGEAEEKGKKHQREPFCGQ